MLITIMVLKFESSDKIDRIRKHQFQDNENIRNCQHLGAKIT